MSSQPTFYTWRSCSTCRDAKKALENRGIQVQERDFFAEPLTRNELTELTDAIGIENLFSWRSPSSKPYRQRKDTITQDELIDAMLQEPRLIRRPILTSPNTKPIIGFNKIAYSQL